MTGLRKFFVVLVVCGVVGLVTLNQYQADVLVAVLYAFVASNAVEHIAKGAVGEKFVDTLSRIRGARTGDAGPKA